MTTSAERTRRICEVCGEEAPHGTRIKVASTPAMDIPAIGGTEHLPSESRPYWECPSCGHTNWV